MDLRYLHKYFNKQSGKLWRQTTKGVILCLSTKLITENKHIMKLQLIIKKTLISFCFIYFTAIWSQSSSLLIWSFVTGSRSRRVKPLVDSPIFKNRDIYRITTYLYFFLPFWMTWVLYVATHTYDRMCLISFFKDQADVMQDEFYLTCSVIILSEF